jgi:hypothetical protein
MASTASTTHEFLVCDPGHNGTLRWVQCRDVASNKVPYQQLREQIGGFLELAHGSQSMQDTVTCYANDDSTGLTKNLHFPGFSGPVVVVRTTPHAANADWEQDGESYGWASTDQAGKLSIEQQIHAHAGSSAARSFEQHNTAMRSIGPMVIGPDGTISEKQCEQCGDDAVLPVVCIDGMDINIFLCREHHPENHPEHGSTAAASASPAAEQ